MSLVSRGLNQPCYPLPIWSPALPTKPKVDVFLRRFGSMLRHAQTRGSVALAPLSA